MTTGDLPGFSDVPAGSSWIAGAENSRLKLFFRMDICAISSHSGISRGPGED